jgi:tetratricopeptide (TPR) repeat protein
MGLSYFIWGKFDEAAASGRKAIELDPDDFIACWTLGRIKFSTGSFSEALDLFHRVIAIKPGFYVAYSDLKQTYEALGLTTEAEATARQLLEMMPNYLLQNPDDSRARMFYGITLLETGDRERAIAEGAAALELSPGDSVMLYNGACLYSRLGETRRAVATLREAIAAGVTNYAWMKHDPDFDPIRNDPEFIELMQGH